MFGQLNKHDVVVITAPVYKLYKTGGGREVLIFIFPNIIKSTSSTIMP